MCEIPICEQCGSSVNEQTIIVNKGNSLCAACFYGQDVIDKQREDVFSDIVESYL